MRAGRLDQSFSVERPVKTRTDSGGTVVTWELFIDGAWGQFTGLNGDEPFQADAFHKEAIYEVLTRPISGITTEMRLVANGRHFDILFIDDMTSRAQIKMRVRDGKSKGS